MLAVERRADAPGDEVRWRVAGMPDWFGPALRAAVALGVPTLVLSEYEEPWSSMALPASTRLFRLAMLPLRISFRNPPRAAFVEGAASFTLHRCMVTKDAVVHVHIMPLSARSDRRGGPPRGSRVGMTYTLKLAAEGCGDFRLTAALADDGGWRLDAMEKADVHFTATRADAAASVALWRTVLGPTAPLVHMQRKIWRFVEPVTEACPLQWVSQTPTPLGWAVRWDADRGRLCCRASLPGDHDEEDRAAAQEALAAIGPLRVEARGAGLALLPDPAAASAVVFVGSPAALAFEVSGGDALQALAEEVRWDLPRAWALARAGEGLVLQPREERNEIIVVHGDALVASPPSVVPPPRSDSDWAPIPMFHLRLGDSLRFRADATWGTGARGAPWAAACFGAPPVTRGQDGAWEVSIDPVGHLSADDILLAALDAMRRGIAQARTALEFCYVGPAIPRCLTASVAPEPPPTATRVSPGVTLECAECGAVQRFEPAQNVVCGTIGCVSSVFHKMRAEDSVLRLRLDDLLKLRPTT